VWNLVGPGNHVLDWIQIPCEWAILRGRRAVHAMSCAKMAELCKNGRIDSYAVWDVDLGGPKEAC